MSTRESRDDRSGDYPALYRFTYLYEIPVRIDDEFSHMDTRTGQFDVVALTPGLAIEAFKSEFPTKLYTPTQGPTFQCYVDAIVHLGKNYGGHFS